MKIPERPPKVEKDYSYGAVLADLIKIDKFRDFFEINDNKYPYWDKWKYIAKEWHYDPQKLWSAVKSTRHGNRLYFSSPYEFIMNAPSIVQQHLHEFDMNLGGSLQGESIIPSQDKNRYLISSLMEEAIASSQLEGAVTTRKLAKEMLETNRKPRNSSEQMIVNNYEAMKWIASNKELRFTPENILRLHSMITNNTLSRKEEEGIFRKDDEVNVVDVQTGNIIYKPPSHEQVDRLIHSFCVFANDKDKQVFFIHPVSKAIILHFLIGYIHPFADGNGRTARTIFYWYLLKKGYWLIEYMSVSRVILHAKAQYARAYLYTEIDDNDLTYFIIYNIKCIKTALDDLKKYVERKVAEKRNALSLLRNNTFNERQIVLLQEMIHDQDTYYTVDQIEKWFNISNQTARNDLNSLVEAGLLEFRRAGKKIHYFPVKDFSVKINKRP